MAKRRSGRPAARSCAPIHLLTKTDTRVKPAPRCPSSRPSMLLHPNIQGGPLKTLVATRATERAWRRNERMIDTRRCRQACPAPPSAINAALMSSNAGAACAAVAPSVRWRAHAAVVRATNALEPRLPAPSWLSADGDMPAWPALWGGSSFSSATSMRRVTGSSSRSLLHFIHKFMSIGRLVNAMTHFTVPPSR
jgi:hypothetical protein